MTGSPIGNMMVLNKGFSDKCLDCILLLPAGLRLFSAFNWLLGDNEDCDSLL